METWAIIKVGGKQYKVAVGDVVSMEKLAEADGAKITFSDVLLLASGNNLKIGKPVVGGVKVQGKVVETYRDKKIRVVKFKSKSRYLRTTGHRQSKTKVLIEKIES